MGSICAKEKCTGCSTCMNVCPKDAINMVEEGVTGYIYPHINSDKCIDCGLCEKTCPVNHPVSLHSPIEAYAVISADEEDLMSSTSGGASSLLAQSIIDQGGVVYGCGQENCLNICHIRINKKEDAYKIKGSKYVHSNIGLIFRDVKNDLAAGKMVMFSGTPCQVAGLRNFLRKDFNNLLLVDLVCHGVPSQKLLRDNINALPVNGNKTLGDYKVSFRIKGSQTSMLRYGIFLYSKGNIGPEIEGKAVEFPYNDYITAFMSGVIFRENCFSCVYAQRNRCSDITLGDFWGLGECTVPRDRGVSLMLMNTEKGKAMLNKVSCNSLFEKRNVDEAINGNGQLKYPSARPEERDRFLRDYEISHKVAYTNSLRHYRRSIFFRDKRYAAVMTLKKVPVIYNTMRKLKQLFEI